MSTHYLANPRGRHFQMLKQAPTFHYEQRRRRAASRAVSSIEPSSALRLEAIADHENLLEVFRDLRTTGGKAPGIDRIGFDDFSITEVAAALKLVGRAILERRYKPYPIRLVQIPKASGGTRELRIGVVCDRVVAAAVQGAVSPMIDRVLLSVCYGFRTGRSVLDMLAAMERTIIDQGRYIVVTDDVRDAFPSVRIDDALCDYRSVIDDEGVLWLIETLLRGDDGPARTVGIDQGSAVSPMTMNLRLTTCLDRPLAADPSNPPMFRYADNLTYLCRSVFEGLQALQRSADSLRPAGFELKGEGPPTNLRRNGAKKQILGYNVSLRNGRMELQVPNQAWESLREQLSEVHGDTNPNGRAKAVIRGWLDEYGLAIEGDEVCGMVSEVMDIAASLGFYELGAAAELEDCIRCSQLRWERIRGIVSRG